MNKTFFRFAQDGPQRFFASQRPAAKFLKRIRNFRTDDNDIHRSFSIAQRSSGSFYAVNGTHLMTPEDDTYASEWYVPLEALAERAGMQPSELRRLMLANRLPLPSYIRTDGTQMVARDLLELPRRAGGYQQLPDWFAQQFKSSSDAIREWDGYLSGQYVCLRDVVPETIQRKNELVKAITKALNTPEPQNDEWLDSLHRLVDELDKLEPPFTAYDRLRFGGPVSRDTCIRAVRTRFPRGTASLGC